MKRRPTDRELMEMAIEVMRQSVPEPRGDGKASPKVGAVLVKPDGAIETACRGELRHGDHAEFTLLERKNRGNKLDGSTVTVRSPGGPIPPITLEQLQDFSAPMLSRNPAMHFVFARMGMAEEQGLGLDSLRDRAQQQNLPLPRFTWDDPYLVLTLYRSREATVRSLPKDVLEALSNSERQGWQWLAENGRATSSQYAKAQGVDTRTARRHLAQFLDAGLVRKSGSGPKQQYEVRQ